MTPRHQLPGRFDPPWVATIADRLTLVAAVRGIPSTGPRVLDDLMLGQRFMAVCVGKPYHGVHPAALVSSQHR